MVNVGRNFGQVNGLSAPNKGGQVKPPAEPKQPDKSVHIYLNEDSEVSRIENRDDKDKNIYIYDSEGNKVGTLTPGSRFGTETGG